MKKLSILGICIFVLLLVIATVNAIDVYEVIGQVFLSDAVAVDAKYVPQYERKIYDPEVMVVDDKTAPDGANSLRIKATKGGNAVEYTIFDAEPETYYVLNFSYKLAQSEMEVHVLSGGEKPPLLTCKGCKVKLNDRIWKSHQAVFKTAKDEDKDGQVRIVIKFIPAANSILYLDEVAVSKGKKIGDFIDFGVDIGCCPKDYCFTGNVDLYFPEIKNGTDPTAKSLFNEIKSIQPQCVHDKFYELNPTMPAIGFDMGDHWNWKKNKYRDMKAGYRCIDGEWKYSEVKYSPYFDAAGFCPKETQCFTALDDGDGDNIKYEIEDYCVDQGKFITNYTGIDNGQDSESFYCHNGTWTTRTKEIALQLMSMVKGTETFYNLYCDKYYNVLNPTEEAGIKHSGKYRDVGSNFIQNLFENSNLVNEFCVLNLEGQIMVGASLNYDINSEITAAKTSQTTILHDGKSKTSSLTITQKNSFIELIKGNETTTKQAKYCDSSFDTTIEQTDGLYHKCEGDDVYYNHKLKSVIFTKPNDPIQKVPSFTGMGSSGKNLIDKIFEALKLIIDDLKNVLGIAKSDSQLAASGNNNFVSKAGDFDKLYLNYFKKGPNSKPKLIKAIRETRYDVSQSKLRTFLNVEYIMYESPICQFFDKYIKDFYAVSEQLYKSGGKALCTPVVIDGDEWMYSVYIEDPLGTNDKLPSHATGYELWPAPGEKSPDNFWNDLTAKLRVREIKYGSPSPEGVSFKIGHATPVVGTKINFTDTTPKQKGQKIIARTWEFGDGKKHSTAYNMTPQHIYETAAEYTVTLWVMNDHYKIAKKTQKINVKLAPAAWVEASINNTNITGNVTIKGGNMPYNSVLLKYGDGKTSGILNLSTNQNLIYLNHNYSLPFGKEWLYTLNVTGFDRDGVEFSASKKIVVKNNQTTVNGGSSGGSTGAGGGFVAGRFDVKPAFGSGDVEKVKSPEEMYSVTDIPLTS